MMKVKPSVFLCAFLLVNRSDIRGKLIGDLFKDCGINYTHREKYSQNSNEHQCNHEAQQEESCIATAVYVAVTDRVNYEEDLS